MATMDIGPMGFNDNSTPLKMKGLLYNSLSRSKLTYGMETIDLNDVELKNALKDSGDPCTFVI